MYKRTTVAIFAVILIYFGDAESAISTEKGNVDVAGTVQEKALELNKDSPVGADRDPHGCIGSAGYSWCTQTNQCERPWELAEKEGLENTKEAFDEFCRNPAQ